MTLQQLGMRRKARVTALEGLEDRDALRLEARGLREGASVEKLLKTPLKDPVECLIGARLVAIDGELLERIIVEPEP